MTPSQTILATAASLMALLWPLTLNAQDEPTSDPPVEDEEIEVEEVEEDDLLYEDDDPIDIDEPIDVTVTEIRPFNPGRATGRVTRDELKLRLPRSTPDALRYEPGVYVQQTAHSQGSAFIRGRTGQQTVLLFDEVRMNNSLFRQGPNQYFFTIDSATVDHIDVLRGSASTRYGTDAIAGVLNAAPIGPLMDPTEDGLKLRPLGSLRMSSSDSEIGGRAQVDGQFGPDIGFVGGVGGRRVGLLVSGGPVLNPRNGAEPEVPRFAPDGRTMLGTGFNEFTADARVVAKLGERSRLTVAWYEYQQYDAPRTDSCAPPEAPFDECLKYDEQFRTLVYARANGDLGAAAQSARLTLSWQRQHERRTHDRPISFTINGGRDDVDTFGLALQARTDSWDPSEWASFVLRYGGDAYRDAVVSKAWLIFTDLDIVRNRSRGQYIDGSSYASAGAFAELETILGNEVMLKAGGRLSGLAAKADADVESGTRAVDRAWGAVVGNVSAEWWASEWLTLVVSADQGFRAPNLDDLTSRQQTGPGFQFENPNLEPEEALTLETGAQIVTEYVEVDAWVFWSSLDQAIARAARTANDCPPGDIACNSSRSQLQLVNLPGQAVIYGAEASLKLNLPGNLSARGTISYAFGEGPNPAERPDDPSLPYDARVPLSRIPPINGTAELLWNGPRGIYVGSGMRWSTMQDRLAISDQSDARIPIGGTPGFVVADIRSGIRLSKRTLVALVFENVTDEAYRYHGSSVNGPGRSLTVQIEAGY